jgi:acetolactate synthase regulatory subunit
VTLARRSFHLEVRREPGALERVLLVVRRRGLGLEELTVAPQGQEAWRVSITADVVAHEATLALRQFAALVDVRHARLDENALA